MPPSFWWAARGHHRMLLSVLTAVVEISGAGARGATDERAAAGDAAHDGAAGRPARYAPRLNSL
jgi:hypothetical protein